MSHVLNWWSLSNEEIKEFLIINDIEIPHSFEDAIDLADQLYRGELEEYVIMTDQVKRLIREHGEHHGTKLRQLHDDPGPMDVAAYNLNYQEVLNLCESDKLIARLCENPKFWKRWLSKRTGLNIGLFTSFNEEEGEEGDMYKLRVAYDEYGRTGNFEYLYEYKDIMNQLFLNKFIEYDILDILDIDNVSIEYKQILYGGLPFLEYIANNVSLSVDDVEKLLLFSIEAENLESVKYLVEEHDIVLNENIISFAFEHYNKDIAYYLVNRTDIVYNDQTISYLVEYKESEMLYYIVRNKDTTLGANTTQNILYIDDLDLIVYIFEVLRVEYFEDEVLGDAIKSDNLEMVKYAIEDLDIIPSEEHILHSINIGNLEIAKFIKDTLLLYDTEESI